MKKKDIIHSIISCLFIIWLFSFLPFNNQPKNLHQTKIIINPNHFEEPCNSLVTVTTSPLSFQNNSQLQHYFAGNSSDGSLNHPFVLQNLVIGPISANYNLLFNNTSFHVLIQNVSLIYNFETNGNLIPIGIWLENCSNIKMQNITFSDMYMDVEVECDNSSHVSISNSVFSNSNIGISGSNDFGIEIEHSIFDNFYYAAIKLNSSENLTIQQNLFDQNIFKWNAWYTAISLNYLSNTTISENSIENVNDGLDIINSSNLIVSQNIIQNTTKNAIWFQNLINMVFEYNKINLGNQGFSFDNCQNTNITNCHIESGDYWQSDCENTLFRNNTMVNTTLDISNSEMTSLDFSNTMNDRPILYMENRDHLTISNFIGLGLFYLNNCNSSLFSNITVNFALNGIVLKNCYNNTLNNVSASYNLQNGIYLLNCYGNRITNSEYVSNAVGFELLESNYNTIEKNRFSYDQLSLYILGDNNSINDNSFTHSHDSAITIQGGNNSITNNQFLYNKGYPISIFNSYGNIIKNNLFFLNENDFIIVFNFESPTTIGFNWIYSDITTLLLVIIGIILFGVIGWIKKRKIQTTATKVRKIQTKFGKLEYITQSIAFFLIMIYSWIFGILFPNNTLSYMAIFYSTLLFIVYLIRTLIYNPKREIFITQKEAIFSIIILALLWPFNTYILYFDKLPLSFLLIIGSVLLNITVFYILKRPYIPRFKCLHCNREFKLYRGEYRLINCPHCKHDISMMKVDEE